VAELAVRVWKSNANKQ